MKYTYHSSIPKFAMIGRIFNTDLEMVSDEIAAEQSAEALTTFLKEIGMWLSFEDLRVGQSELDKITKDSLKLPDYTVNPWVATQEEIFSILQKCYKKG
jgi:alcohol dehydrogenase